MTTAVAGSRKSMPLVILYVVNQPELGEHRARTGRNVVLVITVLFALALLVNAFVGFFR